MVPGERIDHQSRVTDADLPHVRKRAIVLLLLVGGLAALAASDTVHEAMLALFDAAKGVIVGHPFAGPVTFVVLSALSAMFAFFSSAVLVPAAVYAWGAVTTALLLWIGWMLGGLLAYSLAYTAGHSALRWLAPGRTFRRYQERLRREASFGFVLLFQLALPSEVPGYVLGLVRYPLARYLAALAIGELPYAVGTMLLGQSFVSRRLGLLFALGVVAVVSVVVLGRALKRRMG